MSSIGDSDLFEVLKVLPLGIPGEHYVTFTTESIYNILRERSNRIFTKSMVDRIFNKLYNEKIIDISYKGSDRYMVLYSNYCDKYFELKNGISG